MIFGALLASSVFGAERPNILMIAIDDINDWVEPLGGHPQAKTPNLDKFVKEGAMVFPNAVCAAPICGPSRSAVLSGFMPSTTGVYGNAHNMLFTEIVKTNATLPEYFSKHGYYTLSNGKLFHKHGIDGKYTDFGHWAWDEHARAREGVGNKPDNTKVTNGSGTIRGESKSEYKSEAKLSWGPTKDGFEGMVDYLVADWTREVLNRDYDKPFFIASGIIKPHLPWYVPQEFFDLYDLDTLQTPEVREDDLNDILNPHGKLAFKPNKEYEWVKKHGLEKEATQAYLASISFVDACLGVMFDALEKSKYADNTIVIIWGDHGWHLGEKQRYLKNTTWNEAVKTPFLVKLPGMDKMISCDRTVSLIDIYPTLVSLCGLPEKELDGLDFSDLLTDPKGEWERPGITVSVDGTSVMGERWHFAQQLDGTEEFYDLQSDPMEFTNLINHPEHAEKIAEMRKWVPEKRVKYVGERHKKPAKYVDAPAAPGIKATRILSELK
ncbi:Choline-sulfatase (EC [Lentimonas sp. CC19]|nr:Choline-sulfatase (EC [Lentimonas sp. CC19]CAA6693993.1 Choline-sulfatase (EC [Lentimonas sp. CC10]CAA7072226.1 Choline-sulfatase (EC [Lentimonas sp. CC11]